MISLPLLMSVALAADWPASFEVDAAKLKLHPLIDQPQCSGGWRRGTFYLYASWRKPSAFDLAKAAKYACTEAKFECGLPGADEQTLSRGSTGGGWSWSYRAFPTTAVLRAGAEAVETFYAVQSANLDRNDQAKVCLEAARIVTAGGTTP